MTQKTENMECNKLHREALVERLKETIDKLESLKRLQNERANEGDLHLWDWVNVDVWLAEKTKDLIQSALIDNQLDNF